ncbi:MAG: hypothetical protein M3N95_17090 [Actinomycetota bacterium]|nr:hypothetical protein [Actinomycetota bacterium]
MRTAVAILGLIAAAVFAAYPPARHSLQGWVSHVNAQIHKAVSSRLTEAQPTQVSGASASPNDPALAAFDHQLPTYWLAKAGTASPPACVVTFNRKQVFQQLIVHSGDQGNYVAHGRPRVLRLDFSNGKSSLFTLGDTPNAQTFGISKAVGVDKVTITVEDVYPATGSSTKDVAIAEIEFFAAL